MIDYKRALGLGLKNPFGRVLLVLQFFIMMFAMVFLLYLISQTMDSVMEEVSRAGLVNFSEWAKEVNRLLLVRIPILFLVVFLINAVLGLLFLHRLVGPLERVKRVLDGLLEGKLPEGKVSFRRDDYPIEVGDSLARLIDKLREKRIG